MGAALLPLFLFLLTGCGHTNAFRSLEGDPSLDRSNPAAVISAMQRYNDFGKFDNSLAISDIVSTLPSSTDQQKATALALKGQAITGKAGITGVSFGSAITDSIGPTANLLSILPLIPTATAKNAAKALNDAQTIASSSSTALNQDLQLSRAVANTSVVVSRVNAEFTQNSQGNFVPVDGTANVKESLNALMQTDSDGNSVVDYALNAQDALNRGATLSTEQRQQLDKLPTVANELKTLNDATLGTGSYTYRGDDFLDHRITAQSTPEEIQAAINHILRQANR